MTIEPNVPSPGFREFVWDQALQKWWTDTCGEYGLTFAEASSQHHAATINEMLDLTHDMLNHGEHKGGTTLWGLAREAERRGLPIHTEWDYSQPFSHDWHQFLLNNAGKIPIVLFLDNANELVDAETGIGYSWRTPWVKTGPGLQGHFICVLDIKADGYVCADGANPQGANRYAVYSYSVLAKSAVCGLLALDMKGVSSVYGTTNADGSRSFAAGKLGAGMAALYVSSGEQGDLSIPETYYSEFESFARFTSGHVFRYDSRTHQSTVDTTGLTVDGLYSAWRALKDAPAPTPTSVPVVPADLSSALHTLSSYLK